MIKVLNKDIDEQELYRQKCDECTAELEFAIDDTYIGALGARYVKCPICGYEIMTEECDGIELNSNNIEFPKHFFEPRGIDIPNSQINNWIRECLKVAEESDEPYGYFVSTGSGNTMVIILAYEDEYQVFVTKDYYETSVTKHDDDDDDDDDDE